MGKTLVAIIGAGWKPCDVANAAGNVIPSRTPTLLCPITEDESENVLSRCVKQYQSLGIDSFVAGIGAPGCPTGYIEELHWNRFRVRAAGKGTPVWTEATEWYVQSWGVKTVLMPDPHGEGENQYTTLLRMNDTIRDMEWNTIVLTPGDYVFKTSWLKQLLDKYLGHDVYLSFWPKHDMIILTRRGYINFIKFVETRNPVLQKRVYLDRGLLESKYGIKVMEWEINQYKMWFDRWIEYGGSTVHHIRKLVRADPV